MDKEDFDKLTKEERERLRESWKWNAERDGKVLIETPMGEIVRVRKELVDEYKAIQPFKDERLLDNILNEISKDHLEDDNLKMTLFLTTISSLLSNSKLRMSMQLTSTTAQGKDNCIRAILKHLPKEAFLFITSGTQATIEDDVKYKRCLAISEVNLFKEGGANKNLLEIIKQRTEGGTSAIKKDLRTKNKTLRHEEGEQGSVIFGTTDVEQDEELGTRLMKATIRANPGRIKIVNDNTLENFSDEEKIIAQTNQEDSWIRQGLTYFFAKEEQYGIVIPYAKFLKEKIEGQEIIDSSDARSQRDLKRLLSLTCATTYLFQEQRSKEEVHGTHFLVSTPEDLINTLKYSNEFFNQTYAGMDLRVNEALIFIESKGKDVWVDKWDIQEHLNIKHRVTINKYLWELEQKGFLERSKGVHLNEHFSTKTYKGNHIYYRSVQKASNKHLISVQLDKLKSFLEERSVQKSVQFDSNISVSGQNIGSNSEISIFREENEHLKLNAYRKLPFTDQEIEEAGYTREFLMEVMEPRPR